MIRKVRPEALAGWLEGFAEIPGTPETRLIRGRTCIIDRGLAQDTKLTLQLYSKKQTHRLACHPQVFQLVLAFARLNSLQSYYRCDPSNGLSFGQRKSSLEQGQQGYGEKWTCVSRLESNIPGLSDFLAQIVKFGLAGVCLAT